jgi:hypothetical protein
MAEHDMANELAAGALGPLIPPIHRDAVQGMYSFSDGFYISYYLILRRVV